MILFIVHIVVFFTLFVLFKDFTQGLPMKYDPCPLKTEPELRRLYVATCDTRIGWKEFNALKVWNITGLSLRQDGLSMINVCKGENWGKLGFLTKPLIYLQFLRKLMNKYEDYHRVYVILMDSDTFWSAEKVSQIWNKYDCARKGKDIVLSTEMSCWVGRYCAQADLDRWYNDSSIIPSYSPFANSGVIMGKVQRVEKMLKYVVANNQSYFTKYTKKLKFDDQYAIADYAINIAPSEVSLDYHQQLAASASIHAPGDPPDEGWPFVCMNRTGLFSFSCHIYTNLMRRLGHFVVDKSSCMVQRKTYDKIVLQEELESLASDPIIWHGNGAGKQVFGSYGYQSFKCLLEKRNMTEQDHYNTFG